MQLFFDFLLKHLKLRLSVWLGKAELLSWRSLCKAGNALRGASLSNALRMGKHTALDTFGKKHSSAGAVLKGTAGHHMWAKGKSLSLYGGCRKFLLLFGRIGPLALRPCALLRAWGFLPHSMNILQIPW